MRRWQPGTRRAGWTAGLGRAAVALLLGLAAGAGVPGSAAAQVSVSSVLRGEVRDSAGTPLAGASVVIRDAAGEVIAGTETDEAGRYVMVGLPSGGPYELRVERLGFGPLTRSELRLAAGESRRLDLVLGSRPVELTGLRVVAAPDLVFSGTRTGAATVIEERAIETLPTIERDVTSFAVLSPMVAVDQEAISVAGQNTRFNSMRVDGAVSQDLFGLSPSGVPGGQANAKALPLDAIRQYSVLVAPYDVRQSGFTGGLLNAVTRSGGDRWAASAFAHYRDALFSGADVDDDIRSDARGTTEEFRSEIGGFTLSGPVGSARVFVAGEMERRRRPVPGFNLGEAETYRVGLIADSVTRVRDILGSSYGMEPGSPDGYTLENPLGNAFARVDVPLGGRHDLTLRYNYIMADEDLPPDRLGFDPYQLASAATRLESETHGAMARFASRLGERTTNELMLNVQRTRDGNRAASDDPQVEVRVRGELDEFFLSRLLQAGGAPLAHANELDQTIVQLADNLGHAVGDHLFTVGVDGSLLGIRRRLLPASRGIWRFDSIAALEANAPSQYERLVLAEGEDPDLEFSVVQLAGYAQDEWSVSDALSLTLGLRLDLPVTLTRPEYNREAEFVTGVVTDRLPSAGVLFSPRVGFNWSPTWRARTQVRGGVGIFSGVPPLAWLANAYDDNGLRTGFLVCEGAAAPALDPAAPPAACADGTAPLDRNLTVFDDDFRYPQDLRFSLAVDRELPWGFIGTLEGLYTRALNQVSLEDVNLVVPVPGPYSTDDGYPGAIGPREIFGTPRLVPDRFGPLEPGRRWDGYGHVIRVGNRSRNAALALAAELQRRFAERLDLRLAYTYTRAVDLRSLLYQSATLNYGLTPIRVDPARPETRPSSFARPHRVLASVWTRLLERGGGTDLTLLYVGQSGLPYSYVYSTDMNGDGFPGPGALSNAYNDLFFTPERASDVPASIVSQMLVFQLMELDPCMGETRAVISSRNQCRTPWSNRLDVRLSQGLRLPFADVRLTADVMNVLNLLNRDWGLVQTAPSVVPILAIDERAGCPGPFCTLDDVLLGRYIGPRRLHEATGLPTADLPYQLALPESQWRAQIGLRVDF
jgi:hypothetical protein